MKSPDIEESDRMLKSGVAFSKRQRVLLEMRRDGHTLQQIASRFDVTSERVRQVLISAKKLADIARVSGYPTLSRLVESGSTVTIEKHALGYRASMLPNLSFPDSGVPEMAYGDTESEALRELDRTSENTLK